MSMRNEWEFYAWKQLAIAIVQAHIEDWVDAKVALSSKGIHPKIKEKMKWRLDDCERFFRSPLCASCEIATGESGDVILEHLNKWWKENYNE